MTTRLRNAWIALLLTLVAASMFATAGSASVGVVKPTLAVDVVIAGVKAQSFSVVSPQTGAKPVANTKSVSKLKTKPCTKLKSPAFPDRKYTRAIGSAPATGRPRNDDGEETADGLIGANLAETFYDLQLRPPPDVSPAWFPFYQAGNRAAFWAMHARAPRMRN